MMKRVGGEGELDDDGDELFFSRLFPLVQFRIRFIFYVSCRWFFAAVVQILSSRIVM